MKKITRKSLHGLLKSLGTNYAAIGSEKMRSIVGGTSFDDFINSGYGFYDNKGNYMWFSSYSDYSSSSYSYQTIGYVDFANSGYFYLSDGSGGYTSYYNSVYGYGSYNTYYGSVYGDPINPPAVENGQCLVGAILKGLYTLGITNITQEMVAKDLLQWGYMLTNGTMSYKYNYSDLDKILGKFFKVKTELDYNKLQQIVSQGQPVYIELNKNANVGGIAINHSVIVTSINLENFTFSYYDPTTGTSGHIVNMGLTTHWRVLESAK